MNTITANQIMYKENVTAKAKAIFQYLAFRSNKENTCFPALKTIAKDCSISVSSVQRGLQELLAFGFIRKKHNYRVNGSQTSNIYEVIEAAEARLQAAKENIQQQIRELRRRMEYQEAKKLQTQLPLDMAQKPATDKKTWSFPVVNLLKRFKFTNLTRGAGQDEQPIT